MVQHFLLSLGKSQMHLILSFNHFHTSILWQIRGPECEVVSQQLHDQGAVLV